MRVLGGAKDETLATEFAKQQVMFQRKENREEGQLLHVILQLLQGPEANV